MSDYQKANTLNRKLEAFFETFGNLLVDLFHYLALFTIGGAIVDSGTRKARAISVVVRPPRVLSISATRAGSPIAGWQQPDRA